MANDGLARVTLDDLETSEPNVAPRRGDVDCFGQDPWNAGGAQVFTTGFGRAAKELMPPSYFDDGEGNF